MKALSLVVIIIHCLAFYDIQKFLKKKNSTFHMAEKDICSCREGANTFELLEVLYSNYLVRIFALKIKTGRF
jgi:hypothetical protein